MDAPAVDAPALDASALEQVYQDFQEFDAHFDWAVWARGDTGSAASII